MSRPILSTYRLQLHAGFDFAAATEIVPWLAALGVTHVHASPILAARPGSSHGYDVVDPTRANPELGGEEGMRSFVSALHGAGLGLVLDIVPNHMAADRRNPFWDDLLRHGVGSRYAAWFDVDWFSRRPSLRRRVLLPVLGDHLSRVIERDEIAVVREDGEDRVRYFDHSFPIDPATLHLLRGSGGRGATHRARLRRLLDAQHYRLVFWRRAAREINYRRFFDVNELVALRAEVPEVFTETHALLLEWRRAGRVDGFRIDHPDGLLDPRGYLARLAAAAFGGSASPPVWVEKILTHGERLREDWPVAGTTGYDFLNACEALFIAPDGWAAIEANYRHLVRTPLDFAAVAHRSKRRTLETSFSSGVSALAEQLYRLASGSREGLGVAPRQALVRAIRETMVQLPVYRTYVDDREPVAHGEDRRLLTAAVEHARANVRLEPAALGLLEAALLDEPAQLRFVQRFQQLSGPAMAKGVEDTAYYVYVPLLSRNEVGGGPEASLEAALAEFHAGNAERAARRPAAMLAVTTHDTKRSADVRARIDVLSELPGEWEERVYRWRRANRRFKRLVHGRRAPDTNLVYLLLQTLVGMWPLGEVSLAELRERLQAFALKAAREAKVSTSWVDPDPEVEAALAEYVDAMLDPGRSAAFLDEVARFVGRIARFGSWNALARTVLQLASPGVPDVYQGDELWSFSLVDPDNRRPVDFAWRRALLDEVTRGFDDELGREAFLRGLVERAEDGRIKLHVYRRALQSRREAPGLFVGGDYLPLAADGPAAGHAVAFARRAAGQTAIAIAPRLPATLLGAPDRSPTDPTLWQDTVLCVHAGIQGPLTCDLSGARVEVRNGQVAMADAFRVLPVALLRSAGSTGGT